MLKILSAIIKALFSSMTFIFSDAYLIVTSHKGVVIFSNIDRDETLGGIVSKVIFHRNSRCVEILKKNLVR